MATKAKKKMVKKAPMVTTRAEKIRKDVEKQVREGLDRAINLLPPVPRKAVKDATVNVEKFRKTAEKQVRQGLAEATANVGKLRKTAEKQVRQGIDQAIGMIPPAQKKAFKTATTNLATARKDFRKRAEKLVAEVQDRTETIVGDVQERFAKVVEPVTRRLDVASRADVERLRTRLDHIERRIESQLRSTRSAA